MFKIKKQLSGLYTSSALGNLSLTGAWVAILAARGYSLVEIGIAETVFHIVSLIFEIPSGIFADVFGRRKMLIVSTVMRIVGNVIMIFSQNLFMVCLSIAFMALSYNFSSGSGDALAYDSLKAVKLESEFERYESNQLIIYRLCGGISALCAGLALFIGHKIAYGTDLVTGTVQILILAGLREVCADDRENKAEAGIFRRLAVCFRESFSFMRGVGKVFGLMLCNSLVGAVDTLLLFFLQPQRSSYRQALQVRTNAVLQDMFPSEQRATLTSVESFTFSVVMIFLSPLAGIVFSRW